MNKKSVIINIYMIILGFLSPVYILMVNGTSFIVYLLLLGFVVLFIHMFTSNKAKIRKNRIDTLYFWIFLSSISTLLSAVLFMEIDQWKWQAITFFIYYSIFYFFYFLLCNETSDFVSGYCSGLKKIIIVQVAFCYIQYIVYTVFGIDINDIVFNETLHMVEKASHFYYGEYVPTGFSWHPATLAPLLVIGYCFYYKNNFIKLFLIGAAILTKNSTCLLGIAVCIIYDIINSIMKVRREGSRLGWKSILSLLCVICLIAYFIVFTDFMQLFSDQLLRLFNRVLNNNISVTDISTYYHVRYITGIWDIIKVANPLQILFGTGYGCSGYAFVKVFHQYTNIAPWDIECQVSADLISRGIIGFILTYIWIFKIIKKGKKIDHRYILCMVALLIQYFTYNICFMWVLIFQMIIYLAVREKINIWNLKR